MKKIDQEYFDKYAEGKSYDEVFADYTGADNCAESADKAGVWVQSAMILGSATGKIFDYLKEYWPTAKFSGCEINEWAHSQTPEEYKASTHCMNMVDYLHSIEGAEPVDIIFTNALPYLTVEEARDVLTRATKLSKYFHAMSNTTDDEHIDDEYAVTMESYHWWAHLFRECGWENAGSDYLWRSKCLAKQK